LNKNCKCRAYEEININRNGIEAFVKNDDMKLLMASIRYGGFLGETSKQSFQPIKEVPQGNRRDNSKPVRVGHLILREVLVEIP
jgi:hypothetical protein